MPSNRGGLATCLPQRPASSGRAAEWAHSPSQTPANLPVGLQMGRLNAQLAQQSLLEASNRTRNAMIGAGAPYVATWTALAAAGVGPFVAKAYLEGGIRLAGGLRLAGARLSTNLTTGPYSPLWWLMGAAINLGASGQKETNLGASRQER
jgi:hypothetical protein